MKKNGQKPAARPKKIRRRRTTASIGGTTQSAFANQSMSSMLGRGQNATPAPAGDSGQDETSGGEAGQRTGGKQGRQGTRKGTGKGRQSSASSDRGSNDDAGEPEEDVASGKPDRTPDGD